MDNRYFDNEAGTVWIEDGIIFGVHKYGNIDTLDKAKLFIENRWKIQEGLGDMPAIFDATAVKKMNKKTKKYYANEGAEGLTCSALIVKGRLNTILVNIFLSMVNLHKTPVKMFTDKLEAKRWVLAQHMRIIAKRLNK